MNITSIEKNKKSKDFMSVYIDGQYAFSIREDDYLSMHLYEKETITEEEVNYIKNIVNYNAAKSKAVKFLSLKLRTSNELKEKLEIEGYNSETIENVIGELKSMGYINDKIYSQKYIFDRLKLKPKSKKLMKYELINKGISEEDIDEVLKDFEIDEILIAQRLVKKKFGKYNLKDEAVIKKVYNFLHHRGFNYEIIKQVMGNRG